MLVCDDDEDDDDDGGGGENLIGQWISRPRSARRLTCARRSPPSGSLVWLRSARNKCQLFMAASRRRRGQSLRDAAGRFVGRVGRPIDSIIDCGALDSLSGRSLSPARLCRRRRYSNACVTDSRRQIERAIILLPEPSRAARRLLPRTVRAEAPRSRRRRRRDNPFILPPANNGAASRAAERPTNRPRRKTHLSGNDSS